MDESRELAAPVAFDRYVLDLEQRTLRRGGETVVLPGKAFELLAVLVAGRRAAMSREDLYQRLWPDGNVEDGNLTQTVYVLRRALEPAGTGRSFIETLPRFGYRFVQPVRPASSPPERAPRRWPWFIRAATAAAAGAGILLAGSSFRATTEPLSTEKSVAYSLGMFHVNMRGPDNLRHSVGYFGRIVREAPGSPLGYAGLATSYALLAEYERDGSPAYEADIGLAKHRRDQALARDPGNAEAHAIGAFMAYRFDDDTGAAEREFRQAFAANPGNAAAHHWHALFLLTQNDLHAAVAEWELARRLDPTSEVISRWLGRGYFFERRPDDAIRAFSETLGIADHDGAAWMGLASALEQRGNLDEALKTLKNAVRTVPFEEAYAIPDEARLRILLGRGGGDAGTIARMDRLVARKQLDPTEAALFYAAAGARDRAIAVLRNSAKRSRIDAAVVRFDPRFDPIRDDARVRKLFDDWSARR